VGECINEGVGECINECMNVNTRHASAHDAILSVGTLLYAGPDRAARSLIQRLADKVWQDLGVCPLYVPVFWGSALYVFALDCSSRASAHRTSVLRLPLGLRWFRLFLRFVWGVMTCC
jgi:hypothetical protein